MGAGKSTKAQQLAEAHNAILLSEDYWLAALYPNQINSLEDYIHFAKLIKPIVKPVVQSMLNTGNKVVMDFPANTPSQRAWLKSLYSEVNAEHQLVFIDTPDTMCLAQIAKRRNEQPDRAATDTPEMFAQVTKYFSPPSPEEGFMVTTIRPEQE